MNSRLILLSAVLLLVAANCSWASQLQYMYYNYWNVSVGTGAEMLVGVNTSGPVRLIVIPQSELYNFQKGYKYNSVYNAIVSTGIYQISLNPGAYSAIMDAASGAVTITWGVTSAPKSQVTQVNINGVYHYPLTLSNYSNVSTKVIGTVPITMNTTGISYNATFNGGSSYWYIHLNRGGYIINFSASTQTQALIVVNVTPALINPIPQNYTGRAFPIGVASYGLNNYTGVPTPYVIKTNLVQGMANITAIYAYNAFPPANVSKYGAGLQLNAVMAVISGNKTYSYWLQDVLAVSTNNQTYDIENNVWNYSAPNANVSNGTLKGSGKVRGTWTPWLDQSHYVKYYVIGLPYSHYTFPLYFEPVIFARVLNGRPVVSFGYYTATGIYYYDNVTFSIPASSAYILVTPFYKSQNNVPYDAEFVFCGQHGGEITSFSRMNASLYLYYNSSGTLTPFPAVYSFGGETAEATTDLETSSGPHGVHVFVGPVNLTKSYVYSAYNQTPVVATTATTTTTYQTTQQYTTTYQTTYQTTQQYTTTVNNTDTTIPATYPTTIIPTAYPTTISGETGQNTSTAVQVIALGIILAVIIGIIYALYRVLKFIIGALRGRAPPKSAGKNLLKKR